MALTPKQWKEAKEGFGLEEVPKQWRMEMACCMCTVHYARGKLYTDRQLPDASNMREYQKQVDVLRQNCYCRYHAEQMFGPRDEE